MSWRKCRQTCFKSQNRKAMLQMVTITDVIQGSRAHKAGIKCNVFWSDEPEETSELLKMGIDTPYSTQISYHKIRKKSSKAFRPIRSESRDSVILTNCLFSKNQRFYIIFSLSVCNVNNIYHNYVLKHRFYLILELNTPFLSLITNVKMRR